MPWYPPLTAGELLRPVASEIPMPTFQQASHVPPPRVAFPPATMTYSALAVHAISEGDEPIYHLGDLGAYDKVDELREKYDEMQREMRAFRGKEIFGKTAYDLCLVPNIRIPHKFKVLDFEKYKGNSCPKEHLTMYVRRMSAYAKDDQVLIYYFQESLASPASKWYTNLDKTKIQTFSDLCEAFVQQYQYNVDMAPDRSDLQAMTQENKETFKEYAQRRKHSGRLVKDGTSASGTKKFGSNFSRKKEQEVGMVAHGRPQQNYPAYQHIASITPTTNTTQPPNYQPQFPQYPQQHPHQQHPQQYPQQPYQQRPQQQSPYQQYPQQPYQQRPQQKQTYQQYPPQLYQQQQPRPQNVRLQIDPIPMTYAEILPWLLNKNLVQTRAPSPVPEKLLAWYRLDQTCTFHQGGRGHNIENCYGLKNAVQRLIDNKKIFFTDSAPNVQTNPLPNHDAAAINMVADVQQTHLVLNVQHIRTPLVPLHAKLCEVN